MSEGLIKSAQVLLGVVVGIASTYLTMVSRIESKVEKETTLRVTQATLKADLDNMEQKWWLQMSETNSVRAEINALRVKMAESHRPD